MSDTYVPPEDDLDPPVDDELDNDPPADDDLPPDEGGGDDIEGASDEPPPRQESRAAREIRQLRERAQAAERRAEIAEAVRREVRPAQPAVDPQVEEQAFFQRIADLPIEQQIRAVRDRERQVVGQELGGIRMEIAQARDEGAFGTLVATNPVAARHREEVERRAREYSQGGTFVSREVILKNLLGEIALKRGPGAASRSARAGAGRLAAERGTPGARRSDTAAGTSRRDDTSLEATEARLRQFFNGGGSLADI